MRYIDIECPHCLTRVTDYLQMVSTDPLPRCWVRQRKALISWRNPFVMEQGIAVLRDCGARMHRIYLPTNRNNVIGDDIPGGVLMHNVLCHADGTPRRFDTRNSIVKAAKAKGYTNYVVHQPPPGTDKSKHTTSWATPPVITEEERLRGWYEHEEQLQRIHGHYI